MQVLQSSTDVQLSGSYFYACTYTFYFWDIDVSYYYINLLNLFEKVPKKY